MSNLTLMTSKFILDKKILAEYITKEEPFGFNGLGKFVYMRTYSRVKADGTNECWAETVYRVVNGTYTMQRRHVDKHGLGWDEEKAQKSAAEMFDRIFNLKFTPPGRGLWAMGTDITESKGVFAALNNCGFVSTENIVEEKSKPFRFLMDMSMLGVGIGFDVKGTGKCNVKPLKRFEEIVVPPDAEIIYNRNLKKEEIVSSYLEVLVEQREHLIESVKKLSAGDYQIVAFQRDIDMYNTEIEYISGLDMRGVVTTVIEDTREGWVNSTGQIIESYLDGTYPVVFDYGKIRPAGVLLKTFGGLSSGPVPLIDLHIMIRRIFDANVGKPISTRSIVDIMNLIGKCVVAGNVRRCLVAGTLVHTVRGLIPIENVIAGDWAVTAGGTQKITGIYKQGQSVCCTVRTKYGSFEATPEHRMATKFEGKKITEYKQTKNLHPGDRIVLSRHRINGPETKFDQDSVDDSILTGTVAQRSEYIYKLLLTCSSNAIPVVSKTHAERLCALFASLGMRTELVTTTEIDYLNVADKQLLSHYINNATTNYNNYSGDFEYVEVEQNCHDNVTMRDVYDISVEHTENFAIGAGFISHNSSEIAIGPADSQEFINLKNYNLYPERAAYGWCSNNSVYGTVGMDYDEIAKRVADNGEPGIFWLKTAQDYSRLCDAPDYRDHKVMGTNPCGEQSLCNYELCCLCEVFIERHTSLDDFLRTLKFAYLYAKTVTLGDTHWVETNRVLLRNRRIGCSLTGIAQFLVKNNLESLRVWCDTGYKTIQRYDGIYSDYLAIPRSIKTTSIKPSGCVTMGTEIITQTGLGQKSLTMHEIFRQCGVDLDTALLDSVSGMWVRPDKKFQVRGVDGILHPVTNLFINGYAECVEIPLADGTNITCTLDHKLYVKRDGEYLWMQARDIVETDELVTL